MRACRAGREIVAILKEMAPLAMALVEGAGISGRQPAYEQDTRKTGTTQKEVEVVGGQRPGKAGGTGFEQEGAQAGNEPPTVVIVRKDVGTRNATDDDVLQQTWAVEEGMSRHEERIARNGAQSNQAAATLFCALNASWLP